jgi:hypothetical protein
MMQILSRARPLCLIESTEWNREIMEKRCCCRASAEYASARRHAIQADLVSLPNPAGRRESPEASPLRPRDRERVARLGVRNDS